MTGQADSIPAAERWPGVPARPGPVVTFGVGAELMNALVLGMLATAGGLLGRRFRVVVAVLRLRPFSCRLCW
jgi:hypothetical protein